MGFVDHPPQCGRAPEHRIDFFVVVRVISVI